MGKRKHQDIESTSAEGGVKTKNENPLEFLISKPEKLDRELDNIFSTSFGPVKAASVVNLPQTDEEQGKEEASSDEEVEAEEADEIEDGKEDGDDINGKESAHQGGISSKKQRLTAEEKDAENSRTIFVGNIPVSLAKERSLQQTFTRHLLSFLPPAIPSHLAKVQSVRFRSIAFASSIFGRKSAVKDEDMEGVSRSRKRARLWKAEQDESKANSTNDIRGLTEMEKRKIAFVKGEINANSKTCNAYVVIREVEGSDGKITAQDIVKAIIENANGSIFMDRTLIVDSVAKEKKKVDVEELRRTLYVGNLDFAEDEEVLRKSLETKLKAEMGEQEGYVQRVRIVRDRKSGLGKGFAYVVFKDVGCVDELMGLEPGSVKSSKRKLRFERCKSEPKLKALKALQSKQSQNPNKPEISTSDRKKSNFTPKSSNKRDGVTSLKPLPKRPDIGDKLANLSKEERKRIKSEDEDRIARRLEKKKLKIAKSLDEKKFKIDASQLGKAKAKFKARAGESKGKGKSQESKRKLLKP